MRRLLPLVLLAGCATGPGPDIPNLPPARLGEEFSLTQGGSLPLSGTVYSVVFDKVIEDSRCAVGTTCIWEGNARIQITLREFSPMGTSPEGKALIEVLDLPLELNTSSRFPTTWDGGDLIVELRRLEPVRKADEALREYTAVLMVRKR